MNISYYKEHRVYHIGGILYFYIYHHELFQISIATPTGYDDVSFPVHDLPHYSDSEHYFWLLYLYCTEDID